MYRVYSASNDTSSALWGTVTPYNDTNGISPSTDPMTPTGETLAISQTDILVSVRRY
jgi:hypothetical protein